MTQGLRRDFEDIHRAQERNQTGVSFGTPSDEKTRAHLVSQVAHRQVATVIVDQDLSGRDLNHKDLLRVITRTAGK